MIKEPNFPGMSPLARDLWFMMTTGLIVVAVAVAVALLVLLRFPLSP
ncbi:MAG TPA: hypothetical protein VFR68_07830 [Candidatus Dormibacteraeota bacterium]|nr:hypothetical protein [Candidatus Dormibacteraeota bacterium]